MSRQIVNTNGQGLASATAAKFAIISLVAAVVVLLIFFALDKGMQSAGRLNDTATGTGSAMGAASAQAQ